jgi:hypothetical protein
MKRILSCLFSAILLFASCKKTNETTVPNNERNQVVKGVVIVNGRISFPTVAVYAQYLGLENKKDFIRSIPGSEGFVSMKDTKGVSGNSQSKLINGCEVPDELVENNPGLFDIMNPDGVVEIEGTLYRYDYCNDKVWVISVANSGVAGSYAGFMTGDEISGVVGSFPTYVDALEAVAQGYTTMPTESSVEGNEIFAKGAEGGSLNEFCYINNDEKNLKGQNVLMDGVISYDKLGIYFHFYAKEKYKTRCLINWCNTSTGRRDWNVKYKYIYHRKGQSSTNSGSGTIAPPLAGDNNCAKTFYEGSRGLLNDENDAIWDVNNMYTNKLSVTRKFSGTINTFNYTLSINSFRFVNNYTFNTGTIHYAIRF